jgi:hypothetical protein
LNLTCPLGVRSRPNALLEAFERQFAAFQQSMAHGKAAPSPFADFALDHDIIVETAGFQETGTDFDDWHTDDSIFSPHLKRLQTGAFEKPTGAAVKDHQVLRVEYDSGGIALAPFDAQGSTVDQHWFSFRRVDLLQNAQAGKVPAKLIA